jgi:acetolactate synthase-1/2/3 large subunit
LAQAGIRIIDVRHECAAVYMAHAHGMLTDEIGVALVTAGPGLTNAVTGIANAGVSRAPVLVIAGSPPLPQSGMGALQDIGQADVVRSLCRYVGVVSDGAHVLATLSAAVEFAEGHAGPPGPSYVHFPTDVLRSSVATPRSGERFFAPNAGSTRVAAAEDMARAKEVLQAGRRVVVISGRGARGAEDEMRTLLEGDDLLYLDTAESKGVVPAGHRASAAGARARVMAEADVVVTVGRRLDFQLAYGSPAVFAADAHFVRIAATVDELTDNRRGEAELFGDVGPTITRLLDNHARPLSPDTAWLDAVRSQHHERVHKLRQRMSAVAPDADGKMHPYTLLAAVSDFMDEDTIVVADGGDILSFARIALAAETYLDPGALGCLGVGVPFAISAALAHPDRRVVAVIGDGAFGFTAMEISTAVRTGARAVFVVANNGAWGIERSDQMDSYGGRLVGVDLPGCRYDHLARALGAHGERVETPAELRPALERAFANAPAVVDVAVSVDARSPDLANGLAVVPDLHALRSWDDAERLFRSAAS